MSRPSVSRPSGGFSSRPSRPMGGGFAPPPPPPPRHHHHHHYYGGGYSRSYGRRTSLSTVVTVIVFLVIIATLAIGLSSLGSSGYGGAITPSTHSREKLDVVGWRDNCIVDELGWIENERATAEGLHGFYKTTGVQPYVALFAYDPSLKSDTQKQQYAENYYEEHIDNEGTFLYCYFEDSNPDVFGYGVTVNGKYINAMMDSEATHVFQDYLFQNWDRYEAMDDVLTHTFDSTAKRIMTKTTTGMDVMSKIAVMGIVIAGGVVVIVIMNKKRKHEAERAAETERILNSDIKDL